MNRLITGVMTLIALILIWIASTVLIVDQRTYAIVSTLGKAQPRLIHTPGLYFKWPFPFAQVLTLDKRMRALNRADVLRARCADQKEMGIQWGFNGASWSLACISAALATISGALNYNFPNTLMRRRAHSFPGAPPPN